MRELDFFKNNEPLDPGLVFKKVVHISWEVDYEYLFNYLKNLDYNELKGAKEEILKAALQHNAVSNTSEAKQKYWERLIDQLSSSYNFQKPQSESKDALRKRKKRSF